ncbi:hypothetical protein [Chitinophaga filiformis]|uniref:Uncharacterized protein n=1 Tax=Chitinophaga filiformis TaxID=104663 RepID=A0A1G7X0J2_CHIFI|nr:hypothetical protein [Chitinophaga filiformis]SDG77694.1 hypothetical protein SAMN04488121_106248 [Chitinophaga filiformis]
MNKQAWIGKPWIDSIFILLPPFLSLLVIIFFPSLFSNNKEMPEAGWVVLVLLVDVAHVYSTLYRTYFDPQALNKQRFLLWIIPLVSFIAGVLVYTMSSLLFWRILAYVAVFHFVRQQYGFMRVYSRQENAHRYSKLIDTVTIYTAALYPMAYWHFSGPRNFSWFIENDFVFFPSAALLYLLTIVYRVIVAIYVIKELYLLFTTRTINIPKTAIITGTLVSWYFGIVFFNGDMAFTLLNVVSHGIPYMALIWVYGEKQYKDPRKSNSFLQLVFSRYGIVIFLLLIFLFAFIEEGLWDMTVWQEHATIFGTAHLPSLELNHQLLCLIVPLLALPQITHYILDGFIWKIKKEEFKWSNEI